LNTPFSFLFESCFTSLNTSNRWRHKIELPSSTTVKAPNFPPR
jgi:hypothetical protein